MTNSKQLGPQTECRWAWRHGGFRRCRHRKRVGGVDAAGRHSARIDEGCSRKLGAPQRLRRTLAAGGRTTMTGVCWSTGHSSERTLCYASLLWTLNISKYKSLHIFATGAAGELVALAHLQFKVITAFPPTLVTTGEQAPDVLI